MSRESTVLNGNYTLVKREGNGNRTADVVLFKYHSVIRVCESPLINDARSGISDDEVVYLSGLSCYCVTCRLRH